MPPEIFAVTAALIVPVVVIWLISVGSGWRRLAEVYPGVLDPPPPLVWLGYGVFRGWIGYNGALVVGADERGLHLRAMPVILSFCHPPISIPWGELRRVRARQRWLGTDYALETARAPEVDFAFRGATFARLRERFRQAGVPGNDAG